jgi:hypothetical protein
VNVNRRWGFVALFIVSIFCAKAAPIPGIRVGTKLPIGRIYYHKGPLIPEPNVYVIWYGDWNRTNGTDNAEGQQIVRDFLNAIGGSPYFAINTTYSISNYFISGKVTFAGETSVGYSQGKILSELKLRSVVTNAIGSGVLPKDTSGVYFVLTSSDVNVAGFCVRGCGRHSQLLMSTNNIRYGFAGNGARCLRACTPQIKVSPNGNPGVDGMVSIIAHELSEAVTDPDGRRGWYDLHGFENGDKCAWSYGYNQYQTTNGAWANMGWDFLDSNGNFLYHRDYLIQRNLVRTFLKSGWEIDYCATAYDPTTGAFKQ